MFIPYKSKEAGLRSRSRSYQKLITSRLQVTSLTETMVYSWKLQVAMSTRCLLVVSAENTKLFLFVLVLMELRCHSYDQCCFLPLSFDGWAEMI